MSIHTKGARLTGTVVPAVPTWAIFCDPRSGELFADPVLYYTVWQIICDDGESYLRNLPISLSGDDLIEPDDADNFLGLSLTETPDREAWTNQINAYRQRLRNQREARQVKQRPQRAKG